MKEKLTADVFPGQGKSYVGMGEQIYRRHQAVRDVFELASDQAGKNMARLCFSGPESELKSSDFSQIAVVTVSLAGLKANECDGEEEADVVAGHSLGELTAAAAAGAIDSSDILKLAFYRGKLMREQGQKVPGSMAAFVGLTLDQVERIRGKVEEECGESVEIGNINTKDQIVISGKKALVSVASAIAGKFAEAKARVFQLDVGDGVASHSSLMRPIGPKFAAALNTITVMDPKKPLISCLTGRKVVDAEELKENLVLELYSTINWLAVVQTMVEYGVSDTREIGSGKVLSGLINRINQAINTRSLNL